MYIPLFQSLSVSLLLGWVCASIQQMATATHAAPQIRNILWNVGINTTIYCASSVPLPSTHLPNLCMQQQIHRRKNEGVGGREKVTKSLRKEILQRKQKVTFR